MSKHLFRLPQIFLISLVFLWTPVASSQALPAPGPDQQIPCHPPRSFGYDFQQIQQITGQELPAVRQFREMVYTYRDSDCCFLDVHLYDGSSAYGSIAVANLVWFEVLDPNTGQKTRVDYDRIQKLKSVPKSPALATTQPPVPKALLVIKNLLVLPLFPLWYWLFWDGC